MNKKSILLSTLAVAGLISWGCQESTNKNNIPIEELVKVIDGKDFSKNVAILAHDSLEGRKPFTPGEEKTISFLKQEFEKLGLEPGNGSSFYQEVPLVEIESKPQGNLQISGAGGSLSLKYLDEFVGGSRRVTEDVALKESEIIFVGHGIVAPEYGWNDYEGIDVKGKTVIAIANDPGFSDSTLFRAKNMTYYGRWTYKFEEAARQGAAAILLIHEQGPAGYGWNVVRSSWGKSKLYLQSEDNNMNSPELEGWLTGDAASRLFKVAGVKEDLIAAAKKKGFKPVTLPLKASVTFKNDLRKSLSNNVMALLPGTDRKDEVIIYTAHWDHLGIGEAIEGDSIYNGAIDNATGTAALIEIAKAFVAAGEKPSRSVMFLAVTAEEQGLLGSEFYAKNPVFPVEKTVANINMDAMSPFGRTKDIIVVGMGQSELEEHLETAAKRQGRYTKGMANQSTGTYFRSDHFNFAKVGIPALYAGGGNEPIDVDSTTYAERGNAYGKRGYHAPFDEYDAESWDISGIIDNMRLFFDVGYHLSNSDVFPGWKEGSEFKAIREKK